MEYSDILPELWLANEYNKVLLIERSAKDSFAGQYEVPGDKVEDWGE